MFGDTACGEPFTAQHLKIDFTPSEELDDDFAQKKCCAFWDHLKTRTDLQELMVLPEKDPKILNSIEQESSTHRENRVPDPASELKETTAVSMLKFVEEKGLIDRTFEAKLPQSSCFLGSKEYLEQVNGTFKTIPHDFHGNVESKSGNISFETSQQPVESSAEVQLMCSKMVEWDDKHPKCRPVCKQRRRIWKGKVQNTSAELFFERKSKPECFRRCPTKVNPNRPCPLGRSHVTVNERGRVRGTRVARVCQAPIDDNVQTPYLRYMDLARNIGAWSMVNDKCAFCECNCCSCTTRDYMLHDELDAGRRTEMRQFDARVKCDCKSMRIMYDK